MLRIVVLACLVGLAACAEPQSEEAVAEENARIVAEVEAVNNAPPPIEEKVPETITYPDIEAHDMFGPSCAYAPGTNFSARVIAREMDAFVKIDGEVIRLAADPAARELPAGTRSLYNGTTYSLRLTIDSEARDDPVSIGTEVYDGTVYLRDSFERVIYQGASRVTCGV